MITQVMDFTGANQLVAINALEAHQWNTESAIQGYFSNP